MDTIEQRMNNFEVTMEQICQLVVEYQPRPSQNHMRNERPRVRGNGADEEEEGSDLSTFSRESRPCYLRHGGRISPRFFRSRRRLEIPLFKREDVWLVGAY